jgi:3-hydroxyisobutyrate dehydrogenase-like beta-hydroxyacid dehydrogenase
MTTTFATKVGLIGLGAMGSGMAASLRRRGL